MKPAPNRLLIWCVWVVLVGSWLLIAWLGFVRGGRWSSIVLAVPLLAYFGHAIVVGAPWRRPKGLR